VTRYTGRVLRTEDTILGKVEFRTGGRLRASLDGEGTYAVELTQGMRGGGRGMRGGGRGMRGGRAGSSAGRGGSRVGQQRTGATAGGRVPPRLDYGFRLTADLLRE
jgi:hypothetical protein